MLRRPNSARLSARARRPHRRGSRRRESRRRSPRAETLRLRRDVRRPGVVSGEFQNPAKVSPLWSLPSAKAEAQVSRFSEFRDQVLNDPGPKLPASQVLS